MATKGGPIEFANDDMGVHPRVAFFESDIAHEGPDLHLAATYMRGISSGEVGNHDREETFFRGVFVLDSCPVQRYQSP
jgi:hypothetical protein